MLKWVLYIDQYLVIQNTNNMKYITLSLLMILFIGFNAQSQEKVKDRDLRGQWKMVFDFDEDYIEEALDSEDIPWFGRIVAESVTGLVFNILDEVDIQV